MIDIPIQAIDLRVLLDVAEGYASENGLDSIRRYAVPEEVQRAISNARAAIRRSGAQTGSEDYALQSPGI